MTGDVGRKDDRLRGRWGGGMRVVRALVARALVPGNPFFFWAAACSVPNAVHVVQGEGYRLSADALGLAVGVSTAKHGNDVIEPLVVEGRVLGGEPGLHRTTRPLNFDGRFAP